MTETPTWPEIAYHEWAGLTITDEDSDTLDLGDHGPVVRAATIHPQWGKLAAIAIAPDPTDDADSLTEALRDALSDHIAGLQARMN